MRRMVLACIWMLMFNIATLADKAGDANESLSIPGLLKVATRATTLGLLLMVFARTWSDARRGPIVRQMLPWLCFGGWAVMSTAWSPLMTFSLGQSVSLILLLVLSYSIAMVTPKMKDVSQISSHLCFALVLLGAALIIANVVAPETFNFARDTVTGGFHPTNASSTAGLGLLLIVSARFSFGWRWTRLLLWPSVLIHCAALYLAHNRASIIATTIVVSGFVLLQASAGWRWLILSAASLATAIYITLDPGFSVVTQGAGEIVQYMARDQSAEQLAAFSGREEMWTAQWASFLRSPWIGHGYFVCSETGFMKVWYTWANWTAHNFWLQVLVGTGIVGGALIAWALISYAVHLVRARGTGVGLQRLISIGAAVLIWQICWGLTNESFVGPLQAESIVFFVVLGLVTGRLVHGRSDERLFERHMQLMRRSNGMLVGPGFRPCS
jgi:hypothetical protein